MYIKTSLEKCFNKSNVKVSYKDTLHMGTMGSIIAGHNIKIIRQEREKKEKEKECDCRVYEARYPLKRKFVTQTII